MAAKEVIETAIRAKKSEFMAQKETLSIKHVRRIIEQDLGLAKKSLDQQKDVVAELIDKIMFEDAITDADRKPKQQQKAASKPPAAEQAASGGRKRAKQDADGMDRHDKKPATTKERSSIRAAAAKAPKKRKASTDTDDTEPASDAGVDVPSKKARARKPPAAAPAGSKHGPRVRKLQLICRGAGISIPPNMYKKNPDPIALEEALEGLLAKHQLTPKSDAEAISRVKAKLELQRDMEGIDLSNIIDNDNSSAGRRPRRAAAQVDFKRILKQDSDDGSNEEEDGDNESDSSSASDAVDSDEEVNIMKSRPRAATASKPYRKRKAPSSSSDGGQDSEDEGNVSGSEPQAQGINDDDDDDTVDDDAEPSQKKRDKQPRGTASKPAAKRQQMPAKMEKKVSHPNSNNDLSSEGAGDSVLEDSDVDDSNKSQQPGRKAAQRPAAKNPIVLADDDDDDSEGPARAPAASGAGLQASAASEQLKGPAPSKQQRQTSSDVEAGLEDSMEAGEGKAGQQPVGMLPSSPAQRAKKKAVALSSDEEEVREQQEEEEHQEELDQEDDEEEESDFEAVEDDD